MGKSNESSAMTHGNRMLVAEVARELIEKRNVMMVSLYDKHKCTNEDVLYVDGKMWRNEHQYECTPIDLDRVLGGMIRGKVKKFRLLTLARIVSAGVAAEKPSFGQLRRGRGFAAFDSWSRKDTSMYAARNGTADRIAELSPLRMDGHALMRELAATVILAKMWDLLKEDYRRNLEMSTDVAE